MNKISQIIKTLGLFAIKNLRKKAVRPVRMRGENMQAKNIAYNRQRFYGPQKFFCYAPFGSIFVSYNGKVSPCYACKAEENLNNKTLQEIWNGEVFSGLRNQFQKGIIPNACSFCYNHLVQENFGSILANKYDHYLMSKGDGPVIAELELSNRCNLECIMCSGNLSSSIRKNREKLPPVQQKLPDDFIEQFSHFIPGLNSIELTGGDPFLIDEYYQILSLVEKIKPRTDILITTNANTYNHKTEELLNKNLRISFNVSLDSLTETTYAQIRKNGSLRVALENIQIFSKYTKTRHTSLGFLVCPLKLNWEELPAFVDFANSYQATLSYHVVFKPAEYAIWSYPPAILKQVYEYLKSFTFKGYNFSSNINARAYNALVSLIGTWYCKSIEREKRQSERERDIRDHIEKAKNQLIEKLGDKEIIEQIDSTIKKMNVAEFPGLVYIELANKEKHEIVSGLKVFDEQELLKKLELYHSEIYSAYFYHLQWSDNDKYFNNMA